MTYKKEIHSSETIKQARLIWKKGDIEIEQKKKKDLEESVALALQNYRDGAIDADDLVAFLVPTRLEETDLVIARLSNEDSE